MQIIRGGKVSRLHGLLLFAGKLLRLYSNSKHLIIKKKIFAGKLSRLEANPRKSQKFSTANDLHYTVGCTVITPIEQSCFAKSIILRAPGLF